MKHYTEFDFTFEIEQLLRENVQSQRKTMTFQNLECTDQRVIAHIFRDKMKHSITYIMHEE